MDLFWNHVSNVWIVTLKIEKLTSGEYPTLGFEFEFGKR